MKKANEGWGGINLWKQWYLLSVYEVQNDQREGLMGWWERKHNETARQKLAYNFLYQQNAHSESKYDADNVEFSKLK